MQTSVDGGQLRLLRVRQSGVLDVLLVERRDVLVPEARDRHVEDVLRQNVKRMRRRSARRLRIVHLPPRETHRMEPAGNGVPPRGRSEEHTSELQSRQYLVCRLLLEKKKNK